MPTDILIYEIELPPVKGVDVVSQELKVITDGDEQVITLARDATKATNVAVPQDTKVRLELRYIDDAGNRSDPAAVNFEAMDTLAPDAPGPFGAITLVAEVEGSPPAEPSPAPGVEIPVNVEMPAESASEAPVTAKVTKADKKKAAKAKAVEAKAAKAKAVEAKAAKAKKAKEAPYHGKKDQTSGMDDLTDADNDINF